MNYRIIYNLVKNAPTPLYVYDGNTIVKNATLLQKAFSNFQIFYSVKANPNHNVCLELSRLKLGAEVVTSGELKIALTAGFERSNILFAGPAKTKDQIDFALSENVNLFTAESVNQLVLLNERGKKGKRVIPVLLRLNVRNFSSTAWETMAGEESHFGIDVNVIKKSKSLIRSLKNIDIVGTQCYVGSQILDPTLLAKSVQHQIEISKVLTSMIPLTISLLDIGGGFGIPYNDNDFAINLKTCSTLVNEVAQTSLNPSTGLILESGRYLVGNSGLFITRVIDVKKNFGKYFVLCDGGFVGFTRPLLTQTFHRIKILKRKSNIKKKEKWKLCGFSCSSIDVLGTVYLPLPEIGDILAVCDAGAYGHSMSIKNFHCVDTPQELYIETH